MDALESQLLIEKTKIKSPGFAAILGFFFPAIAGFYVGKIGMGICF
jgi:TM2 domain-containing membrane protein YozV